MSLSQSKFFRITTRRQLAGLAIVTAASSLAARQAFASDRFFSNAGAFSWSDVSGWFGDTPPSGPPPVANDTAELIYISEPTGSTITLDDNSMAAYQNNPDPAHHLDVGASLSYGSIVVSNDIASFGTLIMDRSTTPSSTTIPYLTSSQFFVGGWGAAAGTGSGGGVGTFIMDDGTLSVPNGTLAIGDSNSTTNLGSGTILMSGGTISMGNGTILLAFTNSYGTIIQSGGDITTNKTIYIGGSSTTSKSGGSGDYQLQGGSFSCATLNFGRGMGNSVAGGNTFNMSGGMLSAGSVGINYTTDDPTNHPNTFIFNGGTMTANTFRMTLHQNAGTLSPGQALVAGSGDNVGSLVLLTDTNSGHASGGPASYTQDAGSNLLLDLVSDSHDASSNDVVHLENNGGSSLTATLNGTIDLRLSPSYVSSATVGSLYDVMTADSISDSSKIKLVNDVNDVFTKSVLTGQTIPTSSSASGSGSILQVMFAGHARPGDATDDATIDSNDFAVLAAHYNQTSNVGWQEGDFNGDGTVNALDFNALATNFGKGGTNENPIGGAVAEDASPLGSLVPEPVSASLLLAVGGLGLMSRNRRRKI